MSASAAEERLARLYVELNRLGLAVLVMGGHAVRFYGIDRSTIDFDLVVALSPADWAGLPGVLARSPLLVSAHEGPSWRPDQFRRFVIGRLPDGRDERLEFWRENHLLAPFAELDARKVVGTYGGSEVGFLSVDDLIRSKETEREDDWRDVRLLEEVADELLLSRGSSLTPVEAKLADLRSQRGFQTAQRLGMFDRQEDVVRAAEIANHPVSRAFLAPFAAVTRPPDGSIPENIRSLLAGPLATVAAGSVRHLALVEAVRRLYRLQRMAEDRADKERRSAGPGV